MTDLGYIQAAQPWVSAGLQVASNAMNYKYNKRMMKLQNQYNIDMWKMQADYNSPQQQMQRFQDAGLNPNLIYGQGSNGNMSSAPVQNAPDAPRFDKVADELSKAFNIANLRKSIADAKHAEADARSAKVDADRNFQSFEGEKQFGLDYVFDGKTGTFVTVPENDEIEVVAYPYARTRRQMMLADNYHKNVLIPFRARLLNSQNKMYAPQIKMLNYEAKYKPWSYWIDNAGKGLKAASSVLPWNLFKSIPTKFNRPPVTYKTFNNFYY